MKRVVESKGVARDDWELDGVEWGCETTIAGVDAGRQKSSGESGDLSVVNSKSMGCVHWERDGLMCVVTGMEEGVERG